MKFPNAAKGIKKLYTAELLTILSTLSLFVGIIMVMVKAPSLAQSAGSDIVSAANSLGFGLIFCILAFFVFAVVAVILHLIGIINASRDEANFKSALFLLIAGVVLTGIAGALVSRHIVFMLLYTFAGLVSFVSVLFIVSGFVKLADRMNRGDISSKGSSVVKILLALAIVSLIVGIVSAFTGPVEKSVVTGIMTLVMLALEIAQSVICLSFYAKAKKMLLKG